jgi:anti-sigma-K factor RskA
MRLIVAVAATVFAASVILATTAYTQSTNNPDVVRVSLNESYNKCVSLAKSRGYTESDLDGNRAAARTFVLRCMQGRQQ